MFFCQENLGNVVLRNLSSSAFDEIDIISGYVGVGPVAELKDKLSTCKIKAVVIYGMYGVDGISEPLHEGLKKLNGGDVRILYANTPIHSKCYVFKRNGRVKYALEGSANFTISGMFTSFKESLTEVRGNDLDTVGAYVASILENSIPCDSTQIIANEISTFRVVTPANAGSDAIRSITSTLPICRMFLCDPNTGEIPKKSGLNWGFQGGHGSVSKDDAYIAIHADYIDRFPTMFPKKQSRPLRSEVGSEGRASRENDAIEIIWDDGRVMRGLLEGSFPHEGIKYPKQISSFPSKAELGLYLRQRLGVKSGTLVTKNDLDLYGRRSINVSLIGDGIYYFDFKKPFAQEKQDSTS
jgi:hypothetical protein